ncbi:MAG: hypothetical protein LBK50_01550 [Candidatus Nomurabacteria bacterium]|jgi:hypothetical protein|nr:hypothetical protein [Candidatus Nomurabacteria bacterium]
MDKNELAMTELRKEFEVREYFKLKRAANGKLYIVINDEHYDFIQCCKCFSEFTASDEKFIVVNGDYWRAAGMHAIISYFSFEIRHIGLPRGDKEIAQVFERDDLCLSEHNYAIICDRFALKEAEKKRVEVYETTIAELEYYIDVNKKEVKSLRRSLKAYSQKVKQAKKFLPPLKST